MNKKLKIRGSWPLAVSLQFHGADIIPMQPSRRANIEQYQVIATANNQLIKWHDTESRVGGGGGRLTALLST